MRLQSLKMQQGTEVEWYHKLKEIAETILVIASVLGGALALLYRFVLRPAAPLYSYFKELLRIPVSIGEIRETLNVSNGQTVKELLLSQGADLERINAASSIALSLIRERYNTASLEAVAQFNPDGTLAWANQEFLHLAEADSIPEIAGRRWQNIIDGGSRQMVIAALEDALRNQTSLEISFKLLNNGPARFILEPIQSIKAPETVSGYIGKLVLLEKDTDGKHTPKSG